METLLHSFAGGSGSDGEQPYDALTNLNGTLYGTTAYDSSSVCVTYSGSPCGAVFTITTSGVEKVLYFFASELTGTNPYAGLVNVKGTLYGTTYYGGVVQPSGDGDGTVFKITTAGKEKVLYGFTGRRDGMHPYAGLTYVNGMLYGTAQYGGAGPCRSPSGPGCGTVFRSTTGGVEKVLHRFAGGSDGANPYAGLTNVNGTLYGTTHDGGGTGCFGLGCGTVFKITTAGVEKVLYRFTGGSDGSNPYAGLTNVNGTLYGTTQYGGTNYSGGTVFKITTVGKETVLYSFCAMIQCNDGAEPYAGLTYVKGTLYGTTSAGGSGGGTVYSLSGF